MNIVKKKKKEEVEDDKRQQKCRSEETRIGLIYTREEFDVEK